MFPLSSGCFTIATIAIPKELVGFRVQGSLVFSVSGLEAFRMTNFPTNGLGSKFMASAAPQVW